MLPFTFVSSSRLSTMSNTSTLRKRRGIVRASITRLTNRLKDLESDTDKPTALDLTQGMTRKLEALDLEFRTHHHALIDLIDEEETLLTEQQTLDEHDDVIAELSARIQQLANACTPSSNPPLRKIASRGLSHLKKALSSVRTAIASSEEGSMDVCLLRQYEEELSDCKKQLADVRNSLMSLDLEELDELSTLQATLEGEIFDCSVRVKKLLLASTHKSSSPTSPSDGKGVKLPKLDVPTFDGNILHWRSFWEQFCVSIHDRSKLSDTEKLVYLQQSLKNSSAKSAIEGLSRSGEYYAEAVECLKSRYDRPRLIHQTHFRMILEAPPLKDGSGKELRRLHDVVQQHLRALKAMDYEPSGPFITSVLELKLDVNTVFEWQKHSQDSTDVPHYQRLLEFINLRAQASETPASGSRAMKYSSPTKPVASFAANADETGTNCILCNNEKHPLYVCARFKTLPHDKMVSTLKENKSCMNCMRPGHFIKQCKSLHRCRKCQKPHHTLLYVEPEQGSRATSMPSVPAPTNLATRSVTSHAAAGLTSNALLMTCRVLVDAPDGFAVEARAILDSASSASFVSERLAQTLCLPRSHQTTKISGIAGLSHSSPLRSIASVKVSSVLSPHKKMEVSAIILPRVTCDLPLHPVSFDSSWHHLEDIDLADPDFGRPGRIDLLLGVDVFVETLLQGRRTGPSGTPSAFETEFGWVLAGRLDSPGPGHVISHHASFTVGDELLRRFWEIEENPSNEACHSPEERSVVQHFKETHYRSDLGRFVVPLPKKPHSKPLGESRSQAVRRFLSLERSLHSKGQFKAFSDVMEEYFQMGHAETVPIADLENSQHEVFYLPMHAVRKESSSTTKIRVVVWCLAK